MLDIVIHIVGIEVCKNCGSSWPTDIATDSTTTMEHAASKNIPLFKYLYWDIIDLRQKHLSGVKLIQFITAKQKGENTNKRQINVLTVTKKKCLLLSLTIQFV